MKPTDRSRLIVLLALLAAAIFWSALWVANDCLRRPLAIAATEELEVARGSSLNGVVRQLAARGVLQQPDLLLLYVRLSGRGSHIHAGEYLLGPGTTALDLLAMLEQGRVRTHTVTLVEGWTVAQMRLHLAAQPRLQQKLQGVPADRLLQEIGVDSQPGRPPEGLFFPDTYVFSGTTADRDILLQAYRRMQEVLGREWGARGADLPYESPYEVLIMASIIERETGVPSERPDIAGVFVRRLQKGMLLQTDPTVIYGLGARFDGNLRRRDLQDATNPFNTYAHRGLPPTPIALPGREAIHAALQPGAGEALYFVAKGDGSHQFSETLEQHQRAVREYQLGVRRSDYRSSPERRAP